MLLLKLLTEDKNQAKLHLPYGAKYPLKCLYILQFQYNCGAVFYWLINIWNTVEKKHQIGYKENLSSHFPLYVFKILITIFPQARKVNIARLSHIWWESIVLGSFPCHNLFLFIILHQTLTEDFLKEGNMYPVSITG